VRDFRSVSRYISPKSREIDIVTMVYYSKIMSSIESPGYW